MPCDLAVPHLGIYLNIIDIVGRIILYCGRAVLSIVGCSISHLYLQDASSITPSCDNQKGLLEFLNIPWEASWELLHKSNPCTYVLENTARMYSAYIAEDWIQPSWLLTGKWIKKACIHWVDTLRQRKWINIAALFNVNASFKHWTKAADLRRTNMQFD